jgi:hypothetical protein
MKKEYGLYLAHRNNNENIDKGTDKKSIVLKGVQSVTGIVTTLTITGPRELLEKEYLNFPLTKGTAVLLTLDNSQQTMAKTLIQAAQDYQKSKGKKTSQTTMNSPPDGKPEDPSPQGDEEKEEDEKDLAQLADDIGKEEPKPVKV